MKGPWCIHVINFHIVCEIYLKDYELHAEANQHFYYLEKKEKEESKAWMMLPRSVYTCLFSKVG